MHIFPYSVRQGTPAARMPQVAQGVIKERAQRLREAGDKTQQKLFDRLMGQSGAVLMEKETFGHSEHFAPIHMVGSYTPGSLVHARITHTHEGKLYASLP